MTLNNPKYVRVNAAENNADSYAELDMLGKEWIISENSSCYIGIHVSLVTLADLRNSSNDVFTTKSLVVSW